MVAVPRVLLLGTLGLAGVALAFLIGARAGTTLDRVMIQSAPGTALLR
jgi:hypothetical protein